MSKKIFARIMGGLGNQMFQFAFAFMLMKSYKYDSIYMDNRGYEDYYWPFELDKFSLPANCYTTSNKMKYDSALKKYHFYVGLYRLFRRKSPDNYSRKLYKKGFIFCGQSCTGPFDNLKDNLYLYGYFQNADLLKPVRKELTEIFTLKEKREIVNKYISSIKTNSVSISVRVAKDIELDKNIRYSYSEKNYYIDLINNIKQRRGEDIQLVISSNNIDKIIEEKWFNDFNDVVFVKDCSAPEQIEIMKRCRDFILSNSTFSWWIGYLGSFNKDSIVLTPKKWFNNQDINKTRIKFDEMEIVE